MLPSHYGKAIGPSSWPSSASKSGSRSFSRIGSGGGDEGAIYFMAACQTGNLGQQYGISWWTKLGEPHKARYA